MRSRLRYLIAGAVAGNLLVPLAAQAAPNDLDRTFGAGGVILDRTALVGLGEEGTGLIGITVLADGGAMVRTSARCGMSCRALTVTRYSRSGVPAGTAGYTGSDGDDVNVRESLIGSLAAPDGSLRLAYEEWDASGARTAPTLRVVSPDGAPGGRVGLEAAVIPAALDSGGGLLGISHTPERLVRVQTDGTLDRAFGRDGAVAVPAAWTSTTGVASGAIIRLAGATRGGVALQRLSRSGALLGSPVSRAVIGWQGGGSGAGAGAPRSDVDTLAVGRGGHAVITGNVRRRAGRGAMKEQGALVAFRPDGAINRSFGTRGLVLLPQDDLAAAVQRNGKVVVAGTTTVIGPATGPTPLIVRRYNADGSVDPSFPLTRIPANRNQAGSVSIGLDEGEGIVVGAAAMRGYGDSGLLLARLRGGEVPALRLTSPKRLRANAVRVVATSSVAGRARIAVRQSGRVVGTRSVRFTRGSQKTVTLPIRGARPGGSLAVSGSLKGASATGVRVVATR